MKTTVLMIGDWMRHANGKCYQVTRIDGLSDGNVHFACGTPHLWEYNNKFEPIPLTDDILKANGFILAKGKAVIEEIGCAIIYVKYERLDEDWMLNYGDSLWPIKYVHELQHALRLCNIEKEIVLTNN